jgi:hypothetical protein
MDLLKRVSRKKYYANSSNEFNTNRLSKSMEIFDLAAIGTGAGLGFGVFILAGHVAHYQAGPAVSLSVLFAIFVAIFAGESLTAPEFFIIIYHTLLQVFATQNYQLESREWGRPTCTVTS